MTAATEIVVCRTGTANLASVFAGLRRAGGAPRMAKNAQDVVGASHVMLPGVGAFGASMRALRDGGLEDALRERIDAGRPTLAICVGLQLLCRNSEETPGAPGLDILPLTATRFPNTVRVPQLGWNRIDAESGCDLLTSGFVYFANSYRITGVPEGWLGATADHGGPFVAALERGPVVACQFHPELSGQFGHVLLERWIGMPC
ncbi:MAG: imidazole glycerol phosphate synthase subunit HisH [Pseudomonadota bacterium]